MTDVATTGLEQLRARITEFGDQPGVASLLGFDVAALDEGHVAFTMRTDPAHGNPMGTLHGGISATLLDSVMGCAVQSALPAGEGYTTLELKVSYLRAIPLDGKVIRGDGHVVHLGGRIATAEGRITDESGRLLATATTTCLLFRA